MVHSLFLMSENGVQESRKSLHLTSPLIYTGAHVHTQPEGPSRMPHEPDTVVHTCNLSYSGGLQVQGQFRQYPVSKTKKQNKTTTKILYFTVLTMNQWTGVYSTVRAIPRCWHPVNTQVNPANPVTESLHRTLLMPA
jgi:hypothetical protein